jgi:hypothetical protein
MPTVPITDELITARIETWMRHGKSTTKAARELNVSEDTVRRSIRLASSRGLMPGQHPAQPGFEIRTQSVQVDKDDQIKSQSFKYAKAPGDAFEIPEGQAEKGRSVLLDADGRTVQQWIKTNAHQKTPEQYAKDFEAAFANFTPLAPSIAPPVHSDDDRLTVYILADWHLGLFAYGAETGGPDWDLAIARRVLTETMLEVIETSPPSSRAIVLGLGDLLHADNARNQTDRSGNSLDVDTRYTKTCDTLSDLVAEMTEAVAAKHDQIDVIAKHGNHDEHSTVGLRQGLRMYWRNEDRVTVDTSPNPYYYHRFGVNLIGGVHGDKTKPKELPLILANSRPEDWAVSTTRHFHAGHIHHDTLVEMGGVHVYTHRAPVAQDAYHAAKGYLSGRSMRSFTYHVEKGFRLMTEVEIQ